jgi:hypothetical protein
MTFDACDRTCSVDAVLAAVVVNVIEGYLSELCVLSEYYHIRDLICRLSVGDDRDDVISLKHDQ